MKRALILLLLCAGCAARPPPPPPVIEAPPEPPEPVHHYHRPAPAPAASGHDSPAAVLRDSASLTDKTYRYVEWDQARPENIRTLSGLKGRLDGAVLKLRQQRHPTADQVAATRAAAEAMAQFFQHKQD